MRIGLLEIIVAAIIITAIVLIARVTRAKPENMAQNEESPTDITDWQVRGRSGMMRNHLKRLGIAFVVAGILFALAGTSMFRWVIQGYIWALIAVVLGFILLLVTRRK